MSINMNEIVGMNDILFLSLDTLRYDVAQAEFLDGNLPNLCKDGGWEERHSPGNYTYAAHHSIFAGYFPTPAAYQPFCERELLFANKRLGLRQHGGPNTFLFEGSNIIEGLAIAGYRTICIGGVIFFSKIGGIYNVFPEMFQESYWNPSFGVTNLRSAEEQVKAAINRVEKIDINQRVLLFINFSAMHAPNYWYLEKYRETQPVYSSHRNVLAAKLDCVDSQKAALRYVDQCLTPLFECLKNRGRTFCIAFSDHGTCYGEDGYQGHHLAHKAVWTVPYREFFLE